MYNTGLTHSEQKKNSVGILVVANQSQLRRSSNAGQILLCTKLKLISCNVHLPVGRVGDAYRKILARPSKGCLGAAQQKT